MDETKVALLDLDGTVADLDKKMRLQMSILQAPSEPYVPDWDDSLSHIKARRDLIKSQPGFWKDLPIIQLGFDIVHELRMIRFDIHVLTRAPKNNIGAWTEKAQWCEANLPNVSVTITRGDKALVYGRVLIDDYPPYFESWLKHRPRGLVICVAQPWNEGLHNSNVIRYDGSNIEQVRTALMEAYNR